MHFLRYVSPRKSEEPEPDEGTTRLAELYEESYERDCEYAEVCLRSDGSEGDDLYKWEKENTAVF